VQDHRQTSAPGACALVGPGRAGVAVARALVEAGWRVRAVAGRDPGADSVRVAAAGLAAAAVPVERVGEGVDLVVVATPDAAIAAAAAASAPGLAPGALVLHLSGACTLDELGKLARLRPDVEVGSLHPLLSFPPVDAPEADRPDLAGVWCAVDGPPRVAALARTLGLEVVAVPASRRAAYHAAATVASNHVVAVLGQAARLAVDAGLPFEALVPLVRASVDAVVARGPAAALTGPVARGDADTVAAHLRALDGTERPAYRAVAREALRLRGRDDPVMAAVLEDPPC
jgi:predicted short-subunit dehydrogenase-like oxidoreductase (DUF2520 family)